MRDDPSRSQSAPSSTRRRLLAAGGAGLTLSGLAGCLGMGGGGGDGGGNGSGGSEGSGGGGSGTPIAEHDAATAIDAQPSRGPDPLDAPATLIAFEDPSCSRCRAFETNVVPKLEADIEAGNLAFVSRTYPVVYPWGKPATQALEATYARVENEEAGADAYWGLFDHYFAEQDAFSADNVLSRTESWLAENTDLDAAAVVADAEAKEFDDAVQTDLDAGDAAGANGTTPSLFLFRDGTYRTKAQGSVSYDVIASALEL
ncbi:DsbA family protein [Halobium salinum]|uniref:DsbA family protein n=1 Tax=Halobium salinum TaxID=1364940 RepID=A0ABD5PAQ0_9EURY|nr:thioredoxin domain-containing protein [Halobium salinum]